MPLRPTSLLVYFIMGISMVQAKQYPVSAFSQLATSAETQAMPSSPSPIVFTLDGIDPLSEVSPLLEARPGGSTISYLEPRIEEIWQLPESDVHSLPWTGRTADTALAVEQAKALLLLIIGIAKQENQPVVIVAHSWGSVLAYRALLDLYRNGDIRDGDIDQLITIGSPLFEENIAVRKFARLHAGWIGAAPAGLTVRQWQSFYTEHDCLGGGVPEAGVENHNLPTSETKCLKAHRAYFEEDNVLKFIDQYVKRGLRTREQIMAGREKLLPPETTGTTQTGEPSLATVEARHDVTTFDLYGIRLYMTYDEVMNVMQRISKDRPLRRKGTTTTACLKDKIARINGADFIPTKCPGLVHFVEVLLGSGEQANITVDFEEMPPDQPDQLGQFIVVKVDYEYRYGRKNASYEDFVALAIQKYGPPTDSGKMQRSLWWGQLNKYASIDQTRPHLKVRTGNKLISITLSPGNKGKMHEISLAIAKFIDTHTAAKSKPKF